MKTQDLVFKEGEGDGWYARNKKALDSAGMSVDALPVEIEALCSTLMPFKTDINRILEIGCSSGRKLQAMCRVLDASGNGIEPSKMAVEDGNRRLRDTDVRLLCGTADKLPYESNSFDLVYFGFCLYLFDRSNLFSALSEADRVLKRGGFLAITDFDPGINGRRPYVHKAGVFSYKQDYSKMYLDSGMYYLLSKESFSHRRAFFDVDRDERVALSVLYKEIEPYPTLNKETDR